MKQKVFIAVSALLLCFSTSAFAQFTEYATTSNQYIKANVLLASGQFQIMTADGRALTYSGAGQWNSYTTFAMHIAGSDVFYTNEVGVSSNPQAFGKLGQLHLADTTYKIGDTIRTIWQNGPRGTSNVTMGGFRITQNIWPTLTPEGGLIMIQYVATSLDTTQSSLNSCKGIFLVLDNDVDHTSTLNDACNGTLDAADNPKILTSLHYDAKPLEGHLNPCWVGYDNFYTKTATGGIPEWYLAGLRFPDYDASGSTLLGKGVLKGIGLVPPDTFYVADWSSAFLNAAWNFDSLILPINNLNDQSITDAATGYKWDFTGGQSNGGLTNGYTKTVATAYGMNDYTGDFAICKDGLLMTLVRVSPRDHRRSQKGNYDSLNTHVDVYVADVDHAEDVSQNTSVHLITSGAPDLIAPDVDSLPVQVGLENNTPNINQEEVGHVSWNLPIDTTITDLSNKDYAETLSFRISNPAKVKFDTSCLNPVTITYHSYQKDVTPPLIAVNSSTKFMSDWIVSDDQNFYDSGLDSIVVISDTNYAYTPATFFTCDPHQGAHVIVNVIDTTKNASFKFRVVDCSGNSTNGSVSYKPTPSAVIEPVTLPSGINVINYPDPFTRATQIQISEALNMEKPQIRVYSVLGTDVTNIGITSNSDVNGSRIITFDGSALPAGLYNVSIITLHGVTNHQMMLMK